MQSDDGIMRLGHTYKLDKLFDMMTLTVSSGRYYARVAIHDDTWADGNHAVVLRKAIMMAHVYLDKEAGG